MKGFLEEYGLIMVVIVVSMIFIAFASPLAEAIKEALMEMINALLNQGGQIS